MINDNAVRGERNLTHRTDAGREEGHRPGLLPSSRRRGFRPRRTVRLGRHDPVDHGDVHRGLLEHAAALEHTADSAAAAGARPGVLPEQRASAAVPCASLDRLELRADLACTRWIMRSNRARTDFGDAPSSPRRKVAGAASSGVSLSMRAEVSESYLFHN